MTVLELTGDSLVRADELLDRASHDVAKYVAMTARNIDPRTAGGRELELVWRDLLQTDGSSPAWALWQPLSEELRELAADEQLAAIDRAMDRLRSLSKSKNENEEQKSVIELVLAVSDGITRLRRDVRRRRIEVER